MLYIHLCIVWHWVSLCVLILKLPTTNCREMHLTFKKVVAHGLWQQQHVLEKDGNCYHRSSELLSLLSELLSPFPRIATSCLTSVRSWCRQWWRAFAGLMPTSGEASSSVDLEASSVDLEASSSVELGIFKKTFIECQWFHSRLWITTEVNKNFPIGLLQMSLKYTNEPPQGIRYFCK